MTWCHTGGHRFLISAGCGARPTSPARCRRPAGAVPRSRTTAAALRRSARRRTWRRCTTRRTDCQVSALLVLLGVHGCCSVIWSWLRRAVPAAPEHCTLRDSCWCLCWLSDAFCNCLTLTLNCCCAMARPPSVLGAALADGLRGAPRQPGQRPLQRQRRTRQLRGRQAFCTMLNDCLTRCVRGKTIDNIDCL